MQIIKTAAVLFILFDLKIYQKLEVFKKRIFLLKRKGNKFGTCLLLFFQKKIAPRLYDVDVSTFTTQKIDESPVDFWYELGLATQ